MELLKSITGMDLVHIPYKGDAPAITDLLAGHIPMQFAEATPALPLIASGKVHALGISGMRAFQMRRTFRRWQRLAHRGSTSCHGR